MRSEIAVIYDTLDQWEMLGITCEAPLTLLFVHIQCALQACERSSLCDEDLHTHLDLYADVLILSIRHKHSYALINSYICEYLVPLPFIFSHVFYGFIIILYFIYKFSNHQCYCHTRHTHKLKKQISRWSPAII